MPLDTEQTKTMQKFSASVSSLLFTIYFYFLHFGIILAQYLNQSSRGQRFLTFVVVIVQYRVRVSKHSIESA